MEKLNKINFEEPKNKNFKTPSQKQSGNEINQTMLNS